MLVGRSLEEDIVEIGSFSDLQQRLNRKTVSGKLLKSHPAFLRVYDILQDGDDDMRGLPFKERRSCLTEFIVSLDPQRFDLSPLVSFSSWHLAIRGTNFMAFRHPLN